MAETLKNIFHIAEANFIERDGQPLILIRGWFEWGKKGGDALFALLDEKPIQICETCEEGIQIRLKYLHIRAAMDREYGLEIRLPKDFRQCRKLAVVQEEKGERVRLLNVPVARMKRGGALFIPRLQKLKELWLGGRTEGIRRKMLTRLGKEPEFAYAEFRKQKAAVQKQIESFKGERNQVKFLIISLEEPDSEDRLKKSLEMQEYKNYAAFPLSDTGRWEAFLQQNQKERVFVLVLTNCMELEQTCLRQLAEMAEQTPEADFIYGDQDELIRDGEYDNPDFKPGPSEDLLRSRNYIGDFLAVSKEVFWDAGGVSTDNRGLICVYDYVLRCWEKAKHPCHIPEVLCHIPKRRNGAEMTEKEALEACFSRLHIRADVEDTGAEGIFHVRYLFEEKPLVSIIIPNKDHVDDLKKCVDSILEKTEYIHYEILVAENNSTETATFSFYRELETRDERIRVLYWKKPFNYSAINNFAAAQAKGTYYLFLNNDTEVIEGRWLEEMLMHCMRQEVGAVGAQLFYSDGAIQHAGVIIGMGGLAGHAFGGCPASLPAYKEWKYCVRDLSAVTAACMMVKREVFEHLGGFCEELAVAFNDVDLCLRICGMGKRIVYNPYVRLCHHESRSRGMEDTEEKVARFHREVMLLARRHPWILERTDPYYNPNLTIDRPDFSLNRRVGYCCEEET